MMKKDGREYALSNKRLPGLVFRVRPPSPQNSQNDYLLKN